jgi:hypothetical protein
MTKLNPKTETLPDGEESFFHHPGGYLFPIEKQAFIFVLFYVLPFL